MAEAVENARKDVANLLNAQQNEIIFTSGATESNNIAIKGVARYQGHTKPHVITSKIEHKCVLESVRELEAEGLQPHFIGVDSEGLLLMDELDDVLKTFDGKVSLLSVMAANNEVGTIQDIKALAKRAHKHGALFHSDCAQIAGKRPLDVRDLDLDLASLSGHKMHGPKGVGALFVNKQRRVRLRPIFSGGGQESNIRSGTVPVFLCAGMGEAAAIAKQELRQDVQHYEDLSKLAMDELAGVKGTYLNGSAR